MTRDPLNPRPPHEWFFATMRDITDTTCRYEREDNGRIGGPIDYQRLSPIDMPPDGTRCAVLIVGGRMEAGMAFPQIIA